MVDLCVSASAALRIVSMRSSVDRETTLETPANLRERKEPGAPPTGATIFLLQWQWRDSFLRHKRRSMDRRCRSYTGEENLSNRAFHLKLDQAFKLNAIFHGELPNEVINE